jgi:hypothetical protein
MDLTMMERVGDGEEKMEGSFSTGQSPHWAVVPVEEEEDIMDIISTFRRNCIVYSVKTEYPLLNTSFSCTAILTCSCYCTDEDRVQKAPYKITK